jgi:hypothetical protein
MDGGAQVFERRCGMTYEYEHDLIEVLRAQEAALIQEWRGVQNNAFLIRKKLEHIKGIILTYESPQECLKQNRPTVKSKRGQTNVKEVRRKCRFLLEQNDNRPIPTREMLDALKELGVQVGGAAPKSNLAAILSESRYFKSTGSEGWILTEKGGAV